MLASLSKAIIIFAVLSALLTTIGAIIPDPITANIDNAIVFFLSYINYLQPILNVSTVFNAIKLIFGFTFSVAIFLMLLWVTKRILSPSSS